MKSFAKTGLALLAALTITAATAHAQTNSTSTSTNTSAALPRPKATRYTGKITSVDSEAKTITITQTKDSSSLTIHITSKTRIKKAAEAATFADATVGESIFGTAHKDESGNLVASTLNIGQPKPRAATAPPGQ